ncbi:hypothetical protein TeGR_g416 [Tetraparma gracilis]|uniref:Uncharacterized protein n=1 Tax=Tetraparma gracilis TaxID=2962635 RepID=A0ABQ6MD15_9STRA|nr:hypothetical protein TeGR_g416 [Tetraparma gracilis]
MREIVQRTRAWTIPSAGPGTEPAPAVSHVVSLGSVCGASQFLQDRGLRRYAGPFDWIFSSPGMVAHCVGDGFKKFLDRAEHFVAAGHGRGTAGHRFYGAMVGHEVVFNHHDPVNQPRDYAYFVRCVERFQAVLSAANERILFLLVGKKPLEAGAMRDLFDVLSARCAAPFELLGIGLRRAGRDDAPGLEETARLVGPKGTMRVLVQRCWASHTGVHFEDARDAGTFEETVMGNGGLGGTLPLPSPFCPPNGGLNGNFCRDSGVDSGTACGIHAGALTHGHCPGVGLGLDPTNRRNAASSAPSPPPAAGSSRKHCERARRVACATDCFSCLHCVPLLAASLAPSHN